MPQLQQDSQQNLWTFPGESGSKFLFWGFPFPSFSPILLHRYSQLCLNSGKLYKPHNTWTYFPAQQTAVFMGCSAHQMYIMRFTPVRAHDRWSMSLCAVRLRGLKKATQSSPSALGMWGAYRCTFPKLNSWNWTLGFLSERSGAGREKALSPFPMITPDGVCTARVPEHKEAFEREAAFGDPTSPTSEGLPCMSPQY